MKKPSHKVELLAPAGSFEKLKIAIHYGADAVYLAGKDFSLRNFSGNFTPRELGEAIDYARARAVKTYLAVNIFSRNHEQPAIADYLAQAGDMGPDALIIADPGVLAAAREIVPHLPIHLSTQANTTNYNSALFWQGCGVQRVNVARELSLKDIREISERCTLEIEAFVHGAMCMSYSGRCLLSNFLNRRDSNRGMCSHPCRWRYAVLEETRPGQYFPIMEDDRGTYLLNARDLCMIDHLPDLITAGIDSLKIEGRMKGINYLASTVKVYREAIDAYYRDPASWETQPAWRHELTSISHREYSTGFYFDDPDQTTPNYTNSLPATIQTFLGKVIENMGKSRILLDTRNKIFAGETVEVLPARGPAKPERVMGIVDEAGESVPFAQPNSRVVITLGKDYAPNDLIRRPG